MLENSKKLKSEAEKLLSDWKLFDVLNKYGETSIVGSVILDVMVWRDIDIVIIANNPIKRDAAIDIATQIYYNDRVRKVSVTDERITENPKRPKGIYIGVEYITDERNIWKIDIWYVNKEDDKSIVKTSEILAKLDDENRKKIIGIKSQIWDNPNYRKSVTSMDIYDAVLEKGVTNYEEFRSYIKDSKDLLI